MDYQPLQQHRMLVPVLKSVPPTQRPLYHHLHELPGGKDHP